MNKNQEFITMEQMGNYLFADSDPEVEVEVADTTSLFSEEVKEVGDVSEEAAVEGATEAPAKETDSEEQAGKKAKYGLGEVVKSFLEDGIWQDFKVEHEGVTYESLADLAEQVDVTEEIFKGIVATQTQSEIEKIKEASIVVDSKVDPTRRKLAEAIAKGLEDYEPFVKSYDNIIEPLKQMDLSVEQNALALLADYYKNVHSFEEEYISFKLEQHKQNKDIISSAERVREETISGYESILEKQHEEQLQKEKEYNNQISQSKKEFKDKLKELSYGDTFISKALPLIYSKDSGEEHWVKEIRNRMSEDEEFKIEFTHWLLDSDDYINKKVAPIKREEKLKSINLISVLGAAVKPTATKTGDDNILNIVGVEK